MMVCFMLVGGGQVLLWIFIEGSLASRGAKIIGLSLVVRFSSSGLGIDIHATHRVFTHFYRLMLIIQNLP